MKMPMVTVWVDGTWIKIRSPWHKTLTPNFNQDLKDRIDYGARRWDPDEKVWKIDPSHDEILMEILERWFEEVNVLKTNAPATPAAAMSSDNDPLVKMIKLCPNETLPKIYRVIAAALHPDTGGDPIKMSELNMLWSQIKTEKGL